MTDCPCQCHGHGAYPPPCSVPGGCGPHEIVQRCQRGIRCTAREEDPTGAWVGAPATRELCDTCEGAVVDALDTAPELYVALRNAALVRGGAAHGETVKTSRPGSFGLNGHPLWLTDTVHWTLTAWADEVISTARRPTVDRSSQPEGGQVADACRLLRTYLPVWLAHAPVELAVTRGDADPDDPKADPTTDTVTVVQAGWEACSWLIDWQRAAERALGRRRLVHYPPEPCPSCNVPNVLRRRDGSDKVECTSCHRSWTLAMYETFVHAWIGAA